MLPAGYNGGITRQMLREASLAKSPPNSNKRRNEDEPKTPLGITPGIFKEALKQAIEGGNISSKKPLAICNTSCRISGKVVGTTMIVTFKVLSSVVKGGTKGTCKVTIATVDLLKISNNHAQPLYEFLLGKGLIMGGQALLDDPKIKLWFDKIKSIINNEDRARIAQSCDSLVKRVIEKMAEKMVDYCDKSLDGCEKSAKHIDRSADALPDCWTTTEEKKPASKKAKTEKNLDQAHRPIADTIDGNGTATTPRLPI